MLDRNQIIAIAKMRRLSPWQEEKRYVQALILYSLNTFPIVAKGGTYLWYFHGLNRFSEDLDYTAEGKITEEIAQEVNRTLELFGVHNELKIMKDDRFTFSFRIGAQAPLYRTEKDTCYVYVEIGRRERVLTEAISLTLDEPFYGIPMIYLKGMNLKEVLSEKLRAIMVRGNARDLYDTWFLVVKKMVTPDKGLINKKLAFYGRSFDKSHFQARVEQIGKYWQKELKPIIIGALPKFEDVKEDVINFIQ